MYGFGAGGSTNKSRKADKQGGDLSTCKSDSASEVEGCKAPIRLTLRPIREGENPQKEAMKAEDTSESMNAAGMVNMKLEMSDMARSHFESAQTKLASRDGKGCLSELDSYDKLEPKRKSTDPKITVSTFRAQCLMLAGKCDPGKVLYRKMLENNNSMGQSPEQLDKGVEFMATQYCAGKMSPRDELLQGFMALSMASIKKMTIADCDSAYEKVNKHKKTVKPKDDEDHQVIQASRDLYAIAPNCFARAGDCKKARAVFDATFPVEERFKDVKDPAIRKSGMDATFDAMVSKCKAKPAQ